MTMTGIGSRRIGFNPQGTQAFESAATACPMVARGRGGHGVLLAGVSALALTVAPGPVLAQEFIDDGDHEIVDGTDPDGTGSGTQPSPWDIFGALSIGNQGNGTLTIENGGQVSNGMGFIGQESGSYGTVIVSGTDSTWTNSGGLYVGRSGTGTLTIENGGAVSSGTGVAFIGSHVGSVGTVTVMGQGSSWETDGVLRVGHGGDGTLTIADGGQVSNTNGHIGGVTGSDGTATVSGTDADGNASTWTNSGVLYVGSSETGALTISDHGRVTSESTHLALNLPQASGVIALNSGGVLATGFVAKGSGSGTLSFDGGILRATSDEPDFLRNFAAGDVTIGADGGIFDTNGFAIGIATDLQGSGSLTKTGSGRLTLSGSNAYSGGTVVSRGNLTVESTGALGSGPVIVDAPDIGDALEFRGAGVSATNLEITVDSGRLRFLNGASAGNARITNNEDFDNVFFSGASDAGTATILNHGGIGFSGSSSAAASTVFTTGYLRFSGSATAGQAQITNARFVDFQGDSTADEATFVNEAGAWIDTSYHNGGLAIGSVSGDGEVQLGGNTLTLGGLGYDDTIGGVIQDGGRGGGTGGSLTKIGSGTLTLNGINTYTGLTTVSEGILVVGDGNHPDARIASAVAVADGATLGGSGTVGDTTVADGGMIAPGNSIGTLTVDGDLGLSSGSILDYELGSAGGSAPDGISDRIDVTGDLVLNGMLNLSQSGDASDGTAGLGYYRLMTYGGQLTGDGLTIGSTGAIGGPADHEILAGGNNVDLFIAASGEPGDDTLQHWQGGDGTWNATDTQWLNRDGDIPVAWAGNHAAFRNKDGPDGFAGGTISIGGTHDFAGLQFVDDGYRLEGGGALLTRAGGSEIRVLADGAEIATEITGTGGITKTQAGTLILSGQNSYQGGTFISGGSVQVSEDANLGAAAGTLTFDGGRLATVADMASPRSVTLAGAGGFDVASSTTLGLTGTIDGAGDLFKQGAGTLILTGTNSYEGTTLVADGTLVGNAASIRGDIGNAGTVVFDQAGNAGFSGDIGGLGGTSGQMAKRGAGELTLAGASTLDWTIEAGGLVSTADRFTGNAGIAAGGAFTFDQATDAAYAGIISGQGDFAATGTGALLLTGDSSAFAGSTTIAGGTLLVGNQAGTGALGGNLDVLDGAVLGGSGTVGSGAGSLVTVASGGTLAPGNSIGTLTVEGDLTFDAGSHFIVEVDPGGADSDLVHVTGSATLNGGSVAHVGAAGNYDLRSTYTILSAGGELSGEFDGATSGFVFLNPNLIYDYGSGTVDLELVRNDRDFASVALTRNQVATAGGIEGIGFDAGHAVYDAIVQLGDDDDLIRASFDALSGEIHASMQTALVEDSRFVRSAANDRVRAAFAAAGASRAPAVASGSGERVSADHAGPVTWATGFGSWGSTDSDGNAASLDRDIAGLVIGTDTLFGGWRLGLLGGYSQSKVETSDRASSGSSDSWHLGLYGGTAWGNLVLRTGAAYAWHELDTHRAVAIAGLADNLSAAYRASTFQAFGELGYGIELGSGARVEPFANLAHVDLQTRGFNETGGDAALSTSSSGTDVTFTTLGLRVGRAMARDTADVALRGMLGWRHAFGDVTPGRSLAFSAGDAFTIGGAPIIRNSAVVEAGVDFKMAADATFGLSYVGQLASSAKDHGLRVDVAVRF